MKKNLLFIALFFLSFSLQAQYAWISQATGFSTVSTGVRNVSAVDTNVVWISTYDGSGMMGHRRDYSRTINGGVTWTTGTTPAPANYDWSMIYAHNADTAWAMYYDTIGTGGGIYFTGDGGANWAQQGVGTIFNSSSFPDIVYFWDGMQGVSIGDPNGGEFEIYTTVDAGNTWTPVAAADIPNPLASEYGIVGHYSVVGNTIWFDTNKGRVYKSTDYGLTWTVSVTGITFPATEAMNICFYSSTNGLARYYSAAGVNTMKITSDGGATWTAATPVGNFFGSDVQYIPGTASRLISSGALTGFIGSSFSDDGGLTWVDFETSAQRTALGAVDSNNIWAGGFTTSPTSGGIFKYTYIPLVPCTDPNISTGFATANDTIICPNDTLIITSTGVYCPNEGAYSGETWVGSSADISGSTDPLNDPSLMIIFNWNFPAPSVSFRQIINDGSFFGSAVAYGVYYFTPVIFGNATANVVPPASITDLSLDPNCTHSGNSVRVEIWDASSPLCTIGIKDLKNEQLSLSGYFSGSSTLNLTIHAAKQEQGFLRVYDVTGKMIFSNSVELSAGTNNTVINSQNFGTGLYLVQFETGSLKAVSKIAKQ